MSFARVSCSNFCRRQKPRLPRQEITLHDRQSTARKAFFVHHTHTISRWRSQICGRKEIPKKFVSQKLAAQSGQFSVVWPHIRGEHGILMIAFWVNFRYGLYRWRLLFSIFHVHEGAFSFSNFHVCRRCHEGVNEKAAKNARERKSFLIHVPHYVLVSF